MATRNIVPRAEGEGKVGTETKPWGEGNFNNIYNKTTTDANITTAIIALKDGVSSDGETLAKLRALIQEIQTALTSDNVSLDTLQEVVDYIENHQDLITAITTNKVNVADIVDNLTSIAANEPLSANQGRVLKGLLDDLTAATYTQSQVDSNITDAINALKASVAAEGDTLAKLYTLIQGIQTLINSDDVNLDTLQEVVDYIKNNQDLIAAITTNKVNVADIVDALTSTETNNPLSANQGKVLKDLIDSFTNLSQVNSTDEADLDDIGIFQREIEGTITPIQLSVRQILEKGKELVNEIGIPGEVGFGVGICPNESLPAELIPMDGTYVRTSDNYGNYRCVVDNSIMVYIPSFVYKYEADNSCDVKSLRSYAYDLDAAVADGYVIHRVFINSGIIKNGIFIDKYKWSLTNFEHGVSGIASSIKNSNPISSHVETNRDDTNNYAGSFSDCISNGQTPADNYGGAIEAAKSRGDGYFSFLFFAQRALAKLSLAHGQAATSTANCAWYDATGVTNYPKGNNSYGDDTDDATVIYDACDDGYWASANEARKNGSAANFAKTTHNGQNCGVADLNGNQYECLSGMTALGGSKAITSMTSTDGGTKVQLEVVDHGFEVGRQFNVDGGDTGLEDQVWTITDVVDVDNIKIASEVTDFGTTFGSLYYADFYLLKESADITAITSSNHYDSTFVQANFDKVELTIAEGSLGFRYGNGTNQVIPFSTDRTSDAYKLSSVGFPLPNGANAAGSNQFGQDYFYKYFRHQLVPRSGGYWNSNSTAGVWFLYLSHARYYSTRYVSCRSCLYA